MTTLSSLEISKLTAILLDAPVARSATKEAAIARFLKVAVEKNIPAPETILDQDFDAAAASATVAALVKFADPIEADHSAANALIAKFMETEEGRELDERVKVATASRASRRAVLDLVKDETPTTPGLRRLRKSENAEAIRSATAAEAAEATKVKPVKKPTAPKEKPQVDKVPVSSPARIKVAPSAKIVAVVENPKKAGSKAHARFALYRVGATTSEFVAACVAAGFPEKEAVADLGWDRRKGFIKLEA